MSRSRRSAAAGFLCLVFAVGEQRAYQAHASAIADSWSGASASVGYYDQNPSQQGAMASVSAGGPLEFDYIGSDHTTWFHAGTTGDVSASAGGGAAYLLRESATYQAPDPGVMSSSVGFDYLSAKAGWTNDSVTVTAPPGSSLPDVIRLNFALSILNATGMPWADVTATYNGATLNYHGNEAMGFLGIRPDASNSGLVDTSTATRLWTGQFSSSPDLTDTFHIDLALDKSGHSAPFSLGLQLSAFAGLHSDAPAGYSDFTASIALTGITLPDGTSLASLGDTVSFASDLPGPASVPEPDSLAAWGVLIATAATVTVRRARSRRS